MKDERTRYETGNVQAVLDGDLDGLIEAFLQWRRSRRPEPPGPSEPVGLRALLTWVSGSRDPEFAAGPAIA